MQRKPAEPKPKPAPDPRHSVFIDFCFETYREKFGVTLVVDGRAIGAVSQMLKATVSSPDYTIDKLKTYWMCFLDKADLFDRRQPAYVWFCSRVERWARECNCGNGKLTATDAARTYVEKRLKR